VLLGGGFQTVDVKLGVVDFDAVVVKSEFFIAGQKQLDTMKETRELLLQFLFQYKVATAEQAQKLRDLSLKDNPSATDKTDAEKIKKDLQDVDKDKQKIIQSASPTQDESARLKGYQDRGRVMDETLAKWRDDFETELRKKYGELQSSAVDKARQSVAEVGKGGGYTVLFRSDMAPYGANDLTDAATKAMNAKKN
jgi:Skp family chaperone for outer membrane proteins